MELIKLYEKSHRPQLNAAQEVYKNMQDIKDADKEMFIVFYLDSKNKIIAREIVHIGTLNSCIIHPRNIFKGAIIRNANAIIISHNHPSGDTTPSPEDTEITKRLIDAGNILNIPLLDHVIVGTGWKSIIDQ